MVVGMGRAGAKMVMPGNEPLIDIIIPNWNGKHFLETCLESLRRQSFSAFRVIVVDNGSSDGSRDYLGRGYPEVEVIGLPENAGFSVAVNTGIVASRAPWVLLLNNDIEVDQDCLLGLAKAIERYPESDVFALKMINFHQRHLLDGVGDVVLRGGVGYRLGTMESDGRQYQEDYPVFGACAGAALYRRSFFDQVGLFDPGFFAYLEDVDLNLRARRLGKSCMYLAHAKVYHIGSATSGSKFNPLTIRLSTRNNLLVLAKNYSLSLFLRFFPAIFVYQCAWLVFCIKKGVIIPYLHGIAQGLGDFFKFRREGRRFLAQSGLLSETIFAGLVEEAERQAIGSIMARRSASGKGNRLLRLYLQFFFPR